MSFPRLISNQAYALIEVRVGNIGLPWELRPLVYRGECLAGDSWDGNEGDYLCARYTSNSGNDVEAVSYCASSYDGINIGEPEVAYF
jgi:hypothetical protein